MDKQPTSHSKFYMLRCVIAMAHADGVVTEAEIAYISAIMNRIHLTPEQKQTLNDDLYNKQDVADLIREINDPTYRGQILYFARLMAFKDGNLSPSEQDLFDKIHTIVTDGLDMDNIRAEAKKIAYEDTLLHTIKVQENRPTRDKHIISWFQLLDEALLAVGIDLLDS